MIELV